MIIMATRTVGRGGRPLCVFVSVWCSADRSATEECSSNSDQYKTLLRLRCRDKLIGCQSAIHSIDEICFGHRAKNNASLRTSSSPRLPRIPFQSSFQSHRNICSTRSYGSYAMIGGAPASEHALIKEISCPRLICLKTLQ